MRLLRTRQKNPVFYTDRLEALVGDGSERLDAIRTDPDSVALLAWNVFTSLSTHADSHWLAHRLHVLGGSAVRAPVRIALWTGREREPLLRPSRAYRAALRDRSPTASGDGDGLAPFEQPIEVPVRIESPDALVLVDTIGSQYPRGAGGRDRLLELIDAGLDHARRLSRSLTVTVVYPSGTRAAGDLSARVNELRDPGTLRAELTYRPSVDPVTLRETTWQRLIRLWNAERPYLALNGQPVRAFLEHLEQRGLR